MIDREDLLYDTPNPPRGDGLPRSITDAEFDAIARKWAEDNGYVHFGEAVPPNEAWEEFARSNGYVKLDVDVEALRDTLHWMAEKDMGPDMDPRPAVLVGWRGDLVRKVLDAVLDALGGSDAPA
jgi:hypothetical protein